MIRRRLVIDANVWVSGILFPDGVPGELVDMVIQREVLSFHSAPILEEILRNVRKVGKNESDVGNALIVMQQFSQLVEPDVAVDTITGKDSDNRILECAISVNADMVVSGDRRHLLVLGEYRGVPILSPRDAYDRLVGESRRSE
ncbi:MAG: putative toxin-antitoxin system toxin component, PIN family [Thermomicrobiales bacterium]|nr:putative toxin-antitoxin system toxin component, PIN family [Thermomicrobiales bacterium]